jgi:hypothetical protein
MPSGGLGHKGAIQPVWEAYMLRAMTLFLALMFCASAFAQEELPAPVKFGDGQFTFTRGEDDEVALSYRCKEIYRNYFISFNQIAKVDDADVALFSGSGGGNACPPAQLIVTLPEGSPDPKLEIVGEDCGAPEPAVSSDRIAFVPFYAAPGRPEPLLIWTPAGGLIRMGEIRFLPQDNTSWTNFDPSKAADPSALFDNKDVYDAASVLLGDKLGEVVFGLNVAVAPEIIGGKFVAGYGCQPHACGGANAFFGIDLEKRQVYAASRISDQPEEFWPADFTAWPQELRQAYDRSKSE